MLAGPARPGLVQVQVQVQAGAGGKEGLDSSASFYLPKTFSYSCRMSSTIWFW